MLMAQIWVPQHYGIYSYVASLGTALEMHCVLDLIYLVKECQ
jgi:hypothetical protein